MVKTCSLVYMITYKLVGFTTREQAFIDFVLQDLRGWAGMGYEFQVTSTAAAMVVIMKKTNAQLLRKFRQSYLRGLSVTDISKTPAEIWINTMNWNNVPKNFTGSRDSYRSYLIQHEMGHALGYDHTEPHDDIQQLCPVMYQQTKGTRGICTVNPWKTHERNVTDNYIVGELLHYPNN